MNTVRLDPDLKAKIQQLARQQGITQSELHRRALELYCETNTIKHSRFEDMFGVAEGPGDLSSNTSAAFRKALGKKHA